MHIKRVSQANILTWASWETSNDQLEHLTPGLHGAILTTIWD